MSCTLPHNLSLQQCINPPGTISINFSSLSSEKIYEVSATNQFSEILSMLKNNLPDQIQYNSPLEFYPVELVKIFCLIKINSIVSNQDCLDKPQSQFIRAFVKIYNQGDLSGILVSPDERAMMSQILLKMNWKQIGGFNPQKLQNYFEGHALLTAIGCWMIKESEILLKKQQIAFALSFVALHGREKAFTPIVHELKNHAGQIYFAKEMRALFAINQVEKSGEIQLKVQDPYSMRCAPQVYGVSYDVLTHFKNQITESINQPHQKYVCIKGKKIPNLLNESDSLSLKLDFLKCSLQQTGAQSFLRSQRMLNSYLGKNNIQINDKQAYNYLLPMLRQGLKLTSQNKILSQMGNFDTMNINNYQKDICFQTGQYYKKCKIILDNLYYLATLQIMSACKAIMDTHPENHNILFKNEKMETTFIYFCKNLCWKNRRSSLDLVRMWKVQ